MIWLFVFQRKLRDLSALAGWSSDFGLDRERGNDDVKKNTLLN